MDKLLTMSKKELTRLEVMERVEKKALKQREAAAMLRVSERQVRRLLSRYRQQGAEGLISKRRGRPSNNRLARGLKQKAAALLHSKYADFGPTLACEKLEELHGLKLSTESVRQVMIAEGLWRPHSRKRARVHPLRARRACVGELVQIDGSPHAWFEERGPVCTCLTAVDDATGQLMGLCFVAVESTFAYFELIRKYLDEHGLPKAFYSDKHSIFHLNRPGTLSGDGLSQFARALQQLDIELICANTPQAKGRVERAFQTLQDRLVKELRLQGISDRDSANRFAPAFIADYNRRFAVLPRSSHNAHRPLLFSSQELDLIFSFQASRTISKNLTLQYDKIIYQIKSSRPSYALRQAQVTVCESPRGEVSILYKGTRLAYSVIRKQPRQAEVIPAKQLDNHLDNIPRKPAPDHPWRTYGHRLNGKPIPE